MALWAFIRLNALALAIGLWCSGKRDFRYDGTGAAAGPPPRTVANTWSADGREAQ
jgi:hypothetical protein